MKKYQSIFLKLFTMGCALLLSGCNTVIFNPKGIIAQKQEELILIATGLMLIVVIPVLFLTFYFAWKYRQSNKKAQYSPNWHHNTGLEILWWAIPCVIVFILAVITWVTSHTLDPYRPLISKKKPLTIQVIALDWKWLFIYPKQNIATINYLRIPEHTPIAFKITADAPMNSLWIPQLGGQVYAMSGMQTQLHLIANEKGIYDGKSANYSGGGFTGMQFKLQSTSKRDFNRWVQSIKRTPLRLTLKTYNKLVKPSEKNPPQYFSRVQRNLFKKVIMKYMMPKPHKRLT
jgi:cytochrome o ubiquinol oxidase subunit 2